MRTGEPAYSAVMSQSDPTAVLAEMKRTEALLRDARSVQPQYRTALKDLDSSEAGARIYRDRKTPKGRAATGLELDDEIEFDPQQLTLG
jgi:hypothetical protein